MKEGGDKEAIYEATALSVLRSIEGFMPAELVDHVYGGGDAETSARIERVRKSSPELDEALRAMETDRASQSEPAVRAKDRQLDEIVLASLGGPDSLRALLTPDRDPWFVDAVEKALSRNDAPPSAPHREPPPPRSSRRAVAWRLGLAFAAAIALVAALVTLLRRPEAGPVAGGENASPGTAPAPPKTERPKVVDRTPVPSPAPPRPTPLRREVPVPRDPIARIAPKRRRERLASNPKRIPPLPAEIARQVSRYAAFPTAITPRGSEVVRPTAVALTRPDPGNATLDSLRPSFAWTQRRVQAKLERVDADGTALDAVVLKPLPGGLGALPGSSLTPGALYRLTLLPPLDPRSSELPEESRYVFRAPSERERAAIVWADRNSKRRPKESAMVYYLAGRYTDAVQAASAASPEAFANPKSRAWRALFDEILKTRRADPSETEIP